jgi:hypothetical protein
VTRSTNFNRATFDALALFSDGAPPTVPRGLPLLEPPTDNAWLTTEPLRPRRRFRIRLRPTWVAVAAAGIVGTVSGALIAVLSGPVVGW